MPLMEVRRTDAFTAWFGSLRDRQAQPRIGLRLDRAEAGQFGDVRSVGGGVSEMRIDYGPGYRLYFVRQGRTVIVLLGGGDKASQDRDIVRAKAMAARVGARP